MIDFYWLKFKELNQTSSYNLKELHAVHIILINLLNLTKQASVLDELFTHMLYKEIQVFNPRSSVNNEKKT